MTIEETLGNFCMLYNIAILHRYDISASYDSYTNFERNNVFRKFLRVYIDERGNFELPLLGAKNTIHTIKELATTEKIYNRDFVLPINSLENTYFSHQGNTYKTVPALFNHLTDHTSSTGRICKTLYDNNGIKYHGAKGVIFNKDWEPLICITLEAKVEYIQPENNTPYLQIKVFGVNCYIESSVMASKGTIEKFIASKVLPYMCNNKICMFNEAFNYNDTSMVAPVIIIKKCGCSKFFSSVEKPETIVNDSINNFLMNNISDISEDYLPEPGY